MQARRVMVSLIAVCGLWACDPIVDHRGHVTEEVIEEKVKIGSTKKDDVLQMFGSPSSTSEFGDETWYYIQSRKVAKAFLRPEIEEQQVTRIVFDSEGIVKDIHRYGKSDGTNVTIVDETTPTEGHTLGFFEQLFGNLGRFNKDRTVDPRQRR